MLLRKLLMLDGALLLLLLLQLLQLLLLLLLLQLRSGGDVSRLLSLHVRRCDN